MELYEMECQNCGAILRDECRGSSATCVYCGSVWKVCANSGEKKIRKVKDPKVERNMGGFFRRNQNANISGKLFALKAP